MNLTTRMSIKITLWFVGLCCMSVQAISLSTYRVYLDNDNNAASFIMFNKSVSTETCQLSLVHNNFSQDGEMLPHSGDELPANSAEPWMRFSPRNFTVEPRSPQTVRFTLRRKSNMVAAEYRSYMRIACDPIEELSDSEVSSSGDNVAKLSVQPRIVQNIPVIVRTGKLNASVSVGDFSMEDNQVSFVITREGDRSVYGKIEVINKDNDEVVSFRRNISIYPETQKVSYSMGTKGLPAKQLAIRYTEDEAYGGDIIYQTDVSLNPGGT